MILLIEISKSCAFGSTCNVGFCEKAPNEINIPNTAIVFFVVIVYILLIALQRYMEL